MVDLSQRTSGNKRQRSVHLDDATSDRLDRAAALSNSTRSQVLDRLIWEDLKLPDDEATPAVTVQHYEGPRAVVGSTVVGTMTAAEAAAVLAGADVADRDDYDPGPKPQTEDFEL